MTLRAKALLSIGVTLICVVLVMYATSRIILMEGLTEAEEHETHQNVERALGALSYRVSELEAQTSNWAAWDDTYAFIEDANNKYIQSNLTNETFVNLRLNLVLFIHSSGRVVFEKAFDLPSEEEIPISPSLREHLSDNSLLVSYPGREQSTSGIMLLDEGPMVIASRPVLTSEYKGPTRGTLILGRYLDSAEISNLAQITLFPVTVRRVDEMMSPAFQEALQPLLRGAPVFVQSLNTQFMGGYTMIKDIYGKPVLVLRVEVPRDIHQLGEATIVYLVLSILGIGLLAGVVVMLLVQTQVLSRLASLIRSINRIATSGDVSARISMKGSDELGVVAGTINGMLGALQESGDELRELYQHEKELREKLEEEMHKRVEFTRALVHELKTPITPVLAGSELLLEEIKEERLIGLAQSISRGASNLNRRIDELLDLARGEIDTLQLQPESVDPLPLLQEISDEVRPTVLRNGQFLNLELPSALSTVWADRERLRQIVLNLLNNAFKFTPAEGKITLRAREDGANLIVEVEDTGPGISKEDQKRLFEPYHRVAADRERLSGLGLGLALSKSLVELHGGQIWVESRKGKGSTFGFSVPLEAVSQAEEGVELRGKS